MKLAAAVELYEKTTVHCFIRKEGDKHCVKSHSGKNLGCYGTAGGAKKRLKQVEYFKHVKASETYYGPNTDLGPAKGLEPE
jgi:hypothetical protein